MSRVADALRLANLETTGADAFTPHAHPWGRGLSGDASVARDGDAAPGERDVERPSTGTLHPAETIREHELVHTQSPLASVDQAVRTQINGIVERVFLPTSGEAPRVVAFAGVDWHAGSGWIAAAVADMLTRRTALRVAVVDMNVASPQVGEYFGIQGAPAGVEAVGTDAWITKSAHAVRTNLWAMPADGPRSGLDLSVASRARVSRLANVYDHVILSLEPLAAWYGGGLPALVDGIILVIAADATRRQAGRQVAERLQTSGAAVLGAVLTNRRYAIPEAIYKRL